VRQLGTYGSSSNHTNGLCPIVRGAPDQAQQRLLTLGWTRQKLSTETEIETKARAPRRPSRRIECASSQVRSWLELDNAPGESVFILREDKNDPATETRIPLHPGMQLVIDTERLYHVVWHPGPRPRYALITSWESDDVLDSWITAELTPERKLASI
jgi:hypothetical protein